MNDNPYASPRETSAGVVLDPRAGPPRATFTLDYHTVHRAFRLFMRRHARMRLIYNAILVVSIVLIGALVVGVAEAAHRARPPLLPLFVLTAIALIVINSPLFFYVVASFSLLIVGARRAMSILGQQVVEIQNGELIQSTQIGRSFLKLSALGKVYQAGSLIIVTLPLGQFLFIPQSADFGADSFETFYARLKAAVDTAKTS